MFLAKLQTVGLGALIATTLVAGAYRLSAGQAKDATGPSAKAQAKAPPPIPPSALPPESVRADASPTQARTAEAIVAKLAKPVTIEKSIDNLPLREVLDFLIDKYEVKFLFNHEAFVRDLGDKSTMDKPIQLPPVSGVSLGTVLRRVLDQVQGVALVRNDHVEVTSTNAAMLPAYADPVDDAIGGRQLWPLVSVVCNQCPIDDVAKSIAGQSGVNVVVDGQVGQRSDLRLTATLLNVAPDTALRILAELAGLKSVQIDNVFYITDPKRAAELQAEQTALVESRRKRSKEVWEERLRSRKQDAAPKTPAKE